MGDATRNKLAAKIIKAEMLNDVDAVKRFKSELANLSANKPEARIASTSKHLDKHINIKSTPFRDSMISDIISRKVDQPKRSSDGGLKKFLNSTTSLKQMFVAEKKSTASDEARMFMKTSAKFAKEDMETKYFAEEIDDSQSIINKQKRHKRGSTSNETDGRQMAATDSVTRCDKEYCDRCAERIGKHLIVDSSDHVYMSLSESKPFLSSMSPLIIRNNDHSCDSLVSSSEEHQRDTEKFLNVLKEAWRSKGYRCIVMETYFSNNRASKYGESLSCDGHFQVHCLPIREKHYERARMCYKQSLLASGQEWSMNSKLIQTKDGRRIQRFLPKGLSYFWVCFDELTNGFGHVIESEREFSRHFGLEILAGLLDKDFNRKKSYQQEKFSDQFERCRDFKLIYSGYKQPLSRE